jgi:anaerobic magnesium-protoporphyrin IX monomethyl ester cyclase
MADVLLVYPAPDEFKERRFGFSLDLLYLASLLKQAGHHIINYLDYSVEAFDLEAFYGNTDRAGVVIVELDSFPLKRAINIKHGENLVRDMIKRYGSGAKRTRKIILFGNDIAIIKRFLGVQKHPRAILQKSPLAAGGKELDYDYALAGIYANSINTVVESLITGTPLPELHPLDDLDRLPFPDRSLLTSYAEQGGAVDQKPGLQKSTLIRTSTGCLNTCIFCQRKAWHQKYRAHSIPYVLKEFSELKKHNYRNIWVTDDNFTFDLERAKLLLKELSNSDLTGDMKISLSSWARIDEEFLEAAKKAHVSIISFGVETANQEIQRFYRKKIHLERFSELIWYADRIGLYTVGNFILGAPQETDETIKETFDYILDTPFDQLNIKVLDYMAGSELYESLPVEKRGIDRHLFACKENGLNEFPLEVLKGKIKIFKTEFRREREGRLKEKINRYGPPYYLLW